MVTFVNAGSFEAEDELDKIQSQQQRELDQLNNLPSRSAKSPFN